VDKFRALRLEPSRRIPRIAAIDGRPAHVAVEQANDLAALQIDCGNNGELLEQGD